MHKLPLTPCGLWLGLSFFLAACLPSSEGKTNRIVVFAAASLTDGIEALADSFETEYPDSRVIVNVAGTSLLARQIVQGAGVDVFLSANADWMTYLEEQDRLAENFRLPIGNELVVVVPEKDTSEPWYDARRIAIADPQHVPAGLYAMQALQCLGLWETLEDRLLPTLDVRAAVQAVLRGGASAAIVYRSDLLAFDGVQVAEPIAAACQPDIEYRVGRIENSPNPNGARQFVAFLRNAERQSIWKRFGFEYIPTQ